MFLWNPGGLHTEEVQLLEGPSSDPAAIARVGPLGESVLNTTVFTIEPAVMSATGARGDVAVADSPDTSGITSVAVRAAGSSEWSRETLPAGAPSTAISSRPKAVAVDGFGDTTLLVNTVHYPEYKVEIASAYFAPPGGSFTPLAVPGNYFTAIASDAAGRSAIAGYTSSGPDGPGLYLSRRESPYAPFGPAVLLSSLSSDARPQLAYDASGVLTVAWSEAGRVATTTAEPGESVGPAQLLSVPGATVATDEQLSVDAAGEAILTWSTGPHEEFPREEFAAKGLHGVPAPVFATVRPSQSGPFQTVQELSSTASYSEGLYARRSSPQARAVDAIGAGRAMVAWLELGPSGPEVKAALYAGKAGCESPPAPAVISPTPTLTSLRESAKTWREGSRLARISAKESKRKPPVGTTFSFVLDEAATVTLTFTQPANGRRVGGRCVVETNRNKRNQRCNRKIFAGTLTLPGHGGTNKIRFEGLISKHKRLAPGSYILIASASSRGKRSPTLTLHFAIAHG